ncbi:MAG: hypothetical protein CMP08_07880 [Xanthomonadales bacterium]|nr:hypothetical protein [Xanthomonadales bacterium]|tara:strand:+ start:270 stop:812 length:543 start_codon:yes stop_codon:yes gene_type:complete
MQSRQQQGFILVTSLIFLVVLTLLAVSAISSATLQQRMAANQQARAEALDRANSALAYVGHRLRDRRLALCHAALGASPTSSADCPEELSDLPIRLPGPQTPDTPARYLGDAFWRDGPTAQYVAPGSNARTDYVIEALPAGLTVLNARSDQWRFRVTARAGADGGRAARAVAQMIFEVAR